MPPIPQFAKVLAKRAKANPKKISVNSGLPKTTKDDMNLIKVRKIATRKSLEKTITKKEIYSLKLRSIVENLKLKNTKKVNEKEALIYIEEYQTFLKLFRAESKISLLSKLSDTLYKIQTSKKFDIKEINSLINKIIKDYKGVNG